MIRIKCGPISSPFTFHISPSTLHPPHSTLVIALFDFDGTLTVKDSFIDFAVSAVGRRRFLAAVLSASPWLALWKLHLCAGVTAKRHLFSALYKGLKYTVFLEHCRKYAARIDSISRKDIVAKMDAHLAAGHTVYIISASVPQWIAPWASTHGVDAACVIGTEAEVDDNGCLTGRFATPNCTGREKVRRLLAVEPSVEACEVYAYGDTTGDKPMLDLAQHKTMIKH